MGMASWSEKYGYKGIMTGLPGIIKWLCSNYKFVGNKSEINNQIYKIIVEYGEANIPLFRKRGHLQDAAFFIAHKIKQHKKFGHFTQWFLKKYGKI